MAYYKYFDKILYNDYETVNIMNSVIGRYKNLENSTLYYYHDVLDGERPEDISYQAYNGDSGFWWLIIMVNNVVDPYHDWLMGSEMLEAFINSKYGDNTYAVHHFENLTTGKRSDGYDSQKYQELLDNDEALPHNIHPVGNREYEIIKNEEKRSVKVISQEYIYDIVEEFEALMDKDIGI